MKKVLYPQDQGDIIHEELVDQIISPQFQI